MMSSFSLLRRSLFSSFSAEKSLSTLTWVTGMVAKSQATSCRSSGYSLIASLRSLFFFSRWRSLLRTLSAVSMLFLTSSVGVSSTLPLAPVLRPLPAVLRLPLASELDLVVGGGVTFSHGHCHVGNISKLASHLNHVSCLASRDS